MKQGGRSPRHARTPPGSILGQGGKKKTYTSIVHIRVHVFCSFPSLRGEFFFFLFFQFPFSFSVPRVPLHGEIMGQREHRLAEFGANKK